MSKIVVTKKVFADTVELMGKLALVVSLKYINLTDAPDEFINGLYEKLTDVVKEALAKQGLSYDDIDSITDYTNSVIVVEE